MQNQPKLKTRCVLCSSTLAYSAVEGILLHPESTLCAVALTDLDGLSIDDAYELDAGVIYVLNAEPTPPPMIEIVPGFDLSEVIGRTDESPYTSVEWALEQIFADAGVPRLGGASGDRGWSSISTYQKCPYYWKRRYIDTRRGVIDRTPKPPALEIGSTIHTFLAVGYMQMIDPEYPLTQISIRDAMIKMMVTPDVISESWRVTSAYWPYYAHDTEWRPLAVEHHLVDPKTKQSCRIDLIMERTEVGPGLPVGTYAWDHKSAARFDYATLNGWKNDGEIVGIADIYQRTKASKRFGELVGMCVNILGKQQTPNFHRSWVWPSKALIKDHRKTLAIWSSAIDMSRATGSFPRARAGCVGKYGFLCDEFDHCSQEGLAPSDDINDIT
jgi:hypothetical protein